MEDYIWIFILIGFFILWGLISWIRETIFNSKKYLELKPKLDNLENSIKEHESKIDKDREEWRLKVKTWNEKINKRFGGKGIKIWHLILL